MLRKIVLAAVVAVLVVFGRPTRAFAWGAAHAGYTHVGPNGVYHAGETVGYGHGGYVGGVHYDGHYGYAGGTVHYGAPAYGYGVGYAPPVYVPPVYTPPVYVPPVYVPPVYAPGYTTSTYTYVR